MLGNLYGALRDAGVPDDKAQKAAEEVATCKDEIATIKGDIQLLKWMLGFVLASVIGGFGIVIRLLVG
ncbi:integrase [Enterovirga aerilata]|uniref:Integrase n=1 Tax=Enterovirga aerilata TaxID=2730920 RepID=A0A849IG95_9HYPH|nr:integrase [Enterovirga sp. DB1703]NNM72943.1 integrase [Enterovirga sp. DB1703]